MGNDTLDYGSENNLKYPNYNVNEAKSDLIYIKKIR
jgi:hypothetical protein